MKPNKLAEMYKDFHEDNKLMEDIQTEIINQILIQQDKFIENILRNHVNPPIKGEITKGKIKWRGLEIVNDMNHSKLWIKQRGIAIPIYFEYGYKNNLI